ncbi:MAG: hypothetical protein Q9218_008307 [Villophora microphyllina]
MGKVQAADTPPVIPAEKAEKKVKLGSPNNEELVKFLISCIRHGVNGKVANLVLCNPQLLSQLYFQIDFDAVAKDCDIVSKGAAAKRYERLLKANNIVPAAQLNPRDASVASVKRSKPATAKDPKDVKATAEKKRKQIEGERLRFTDDEDDEEPSFLAKKNKRVKMEKKAPIVKTEGGIDIDANGKRHIHHTVMPLKRESSSEEESVEKPADTVNYPLDPSLKYQDNDLLEQYITPSSFEQSSSSPATSATPAAPVKVKQESVIIDDD